MLTLQGRCLAALLLSLLLSSGAIGQQYGVSVYTTTQGLPTDLTKAITQDSIGFIWIATDAGLVRYDGINFKQFEYSLGTNYIKTFKKGASGELYVIHDNGIHEIISRPDTTIFKKIIGSKLEVTDSTISYPKALFIDSKNRFWISQREAVMLYNEKKLKRFEFPEKDISPSYVKSFVIFEDRFNTIWTLSLGGSLYFYNESENRFVPVSLPFALTRVNSVLSIDSVRFWATTTTGIYELQTTHEKRIQSIVRISDRSDFASAIKTSEGEIFLGSIEHGLFRVMDSRPSVAINFERVEGVTQRFINNLFAQDGNLWISSDEGIGVVQEYYFNSLPLNEPTKHVQAVALASDGTIFFSIGHKLYAARQKQHGKFELKIIRTFKDGYIAYVIPYGNGVCISDSNSSIFFLDSEGRELKHLQLKPESKAYYNTIFYIATDRGKNIWACIDHSAGVTRISPDYKIFTYGLKEGIGTKAIVVRESPNGSIYVGSQGNDTYLYKYNAALNVFENKSTPLPSKERPVSVNDIFIDANEVVWLATDDGLYKYHEGKVKKVVLPKKYNDLVFKAIHIASDKSMWLATNLGLVKFGNDEVVVLDEFSGLPAKTINYRCLYEDTNGHLWAGTTEGVAYTQQTDLFFGTTPKPLFLTIKIDGKEVNGLPGQAIGSDSYLEASFLSLSFPGNKTLYQSRLNDGAWTEPSEKSEVTIPKLKSGSNVFQVRARRIGGYAWSEIASVQFTVKTVWYRQWWAVVLYIITGAILFAGLIVINSRRLIAEKKRLEKIVDERTKEIFEKNTIINEQNARLKYINQNLEAKVEEQTRQVRFAYRSLLAANKDLDTFVYRSSHDLRGPIARLLGLCHLATVEVKDETSLVYIRRLEQTSQEMDKLLNRLLRTQEVKSKDVQPEPINVEHLVKQSLHTLLPFDPGHKVRIEMCIPDALTFYSDTFLFNVLIGNVLKNAFQFTDTSRADPYVRIRVSVEDESGLQISIANNGIVIRPEIKTRLFEMFFKTTNEVGSSGLGLYEARIICEKLKGNIKFNAENRLETEFIITLPGKFTMAQRAVPDLQAG